MATTVYESTNVHSVEGTEIEITPLKIKYLREFMRVFGGIKDTKTEDDVIVLLVDCVRVCMK